LIWIEGPPTRLRKNRQASPLLSDFRVQRAWPRIGT
jgi:hypothetical protein